MDQDVDRLFLFDNGCSRVGDCFEIAQVNRMRNEMLIYESDV